MVSSTNHAKTERTNFSEVLTMMAHDIVRMFVERAKSGAFGELGVDAPDLKDSDAFIGVTQRWYPMLPQDEDSENSQWLERLKEGGASIEEFLAHYGVEDIEGEKKLIEDWLTFRAELEAKAQPQPYGGGNGAGSTGTP